MNNKLNNFNNVDDDINHGIKTTEHEQENDDEQEVEELGTCDRQLVRNCELSCDDETCNHMNIDMDEDKKVESLAFVQVMHKAFEQMSFKKGIEKVGDRAVEALTKESKPLHMRDAFTLRKKKSLTEDEWKGVCEAVNSMKEKKDGPIEGRTCLDSGKQRDFSAKKTLPVQRCQWKQHH